MTNLEVLSTVKASQYRDFKDIGKLWQLRKLGVVLDDDKPDHLTYLLEAIGDLSESLQSLSITLTHSKGGLPCNTDIEENIEDNYSNNPPKLLESLRIDGYTCKGQLLPWLLKDNKLPALVKVTLQNTYLNKGNMEHLAELDNLCYLRLMCGAYTDSRLSFLCAKLKRFKYLLVECGKLDEISFDVGAAPELSKIVLSFTSMEDSLSPCLSGISNLIQLKELEFNRDEIPSQVMQDIANHPNKKNLALRRIKASQGQEASAAAAAP